MVTARSRKAVSNILVGVLLVLVGLRSLDLAQTIFWQISVRRTSGEFVQAAIQGDRARLEPLLAPEANLTAQEAIDLFAGITDGKVADVVELGFYDPPAYVVMLKKPADNGYLSTYLIRAEGRRLVVGDVGETINDWFDTRWYGYDKSRSD